MMSTNRFLSRGRLPVAAAIAVLMSACTVQEVNTPSPVGVSETGLVLSIAAAPEFLPRDGSSMSTITVRAFDPDGKPLPGARIRLETNAGTLSATDVPTGSDGSLRVTYVAPGVNENVNFVRISAVPVKNETVQNANFKFVDIALSGPDIPVASFNFGPATPARFETVTFDASTSALNGASCGSACTYSWDFGDGSTDTGRIASHAFQNQGTQIVTLTVTAPSGTYRSTSKSVPVGAAVAPTADFIFSPGNPLVGDQVFFDGSRSKGANGSTITSWEWNFGNNTFGSGVRPAAVVYGVDRTFNVTLTVTDDRGQTATKTVSVTVDVP
jgi:PKD repeat protein